MSAPPALHRRFGRALAEAVDALERLAFWAAVVLPCLHVPLLALGGLSGETTPVLVALWALHGVALLVGRRHRTDRQDGPGAPVPPETGDDPGAPDRTESADRPEPPDRSDRPGVAD